MRRLTHSVNCLIAELNVAAEKATAYPNLLSSIPLATSFGSTLPIIVGMIGIG